MSEPIWLLNPKISQEIQYSEDKTMIFSLGETESKGLGHLRKATPEEFIRQKYVAYLKEHGVPSKQIKIEYPIPMGCSTKFSDIAVFSLDLVTPRLIIECKVNSLSTGRGQLESYLSAKNVRNGVLVDQTSMSFIERCGDNQFHRKNINGFSRFLENLGIIKASIQGLEFIDLFAGIGGFRQAFDEFGKCVFSSEKDRNAQNTYQLMYEEKQINGDITEIAPSTVPDHDLLLAGFPCQAFSIAGHREGFSDKKGRGHLFFNILDILEEKKPRMFLLENVKNLVSHDQGRTFKVICHHLTKLGYGIKAKVLNAKDYGLHQNRERIYMVGKINSWVGEPIGLPKEDEIVDKNELLSLLDDVEKNKLHFFEFPQPLEGFTPLHEINNSSSLKERTTTVIINGLKVEYQNPPKGLERYFQKYEERDDWGKYIYSGKEGHFLKAVQFINGKIKGEENTLDFSNWGERSWEDEGYQYIYQWRRQYVRRNEGGACPTLTANMGTGGHNVPLIVCGKIGGNSLIRKLTPEETALFQGFSRDFALKLGASEISNGQKYKQVGNSVPVTVVKRIATAMKEQLFD